MPAAPKEALTIEPWAAGIGLGTLALVAAAAIFTLWDRAHTASIEDVITPTAVGDTHFAPEPAAHAGPSGIAYQGRKLDMIAERKLRDGKMLRVGTDDSGAYTLYRIEEESGRKDRLFMKAGPNLYMEVTQE